jgi:DNA polymerase/3'-5' exonuclease PolX
MTQRNSRHDGATEDRLEWGGLDAEESGACGGETAFGKAREMNALRRQIEMADSWEYPLAAAGPEKRKFPRGLGIAVARELIPLLAPLCGEGKLLVCGSMRRRKREVGDLEIVFVPRLDVVTPARCDLFGNEEKAAVMRAATSPILDDLVRRGVLVRRLKTTGAICGWGPWNRFATHVASGLPVDFFGCVEASFPNTVVCRTGGKRTNTEICSAAIARGWHWEPSPEAEGFKRGKGLGFEYHAVTSEREVFDFVGLDYREPWERE